MSQDLPSFLKLKVITSRKLLVDEEVLEVSLPSLDGYLGILPGHCHLFLALGKGKLSYRQTHRDENFSVEGGYAEILPEKVLVFTELGKNEAGVTDEGNR